MEKNQNDKNSQSSKTTTTAEQPGTKSYQEQTQEGKKKTETDPNNPVAGTNKPEGSKQDNQQHQGSTSNQGKSNIYTEENEEETIDETPSARRSPESGPGENKPGNQNQNNKRGSI